MTISRRTLLKGAGSIGLASFLPMTSSGAATPPHVVVVGGGFAGSTVAKYLKLWGTNTVQVSLIDPDPHHTSCVLSNLILNDELTLPELQISHNHLESKLGVNLVQGSVSSVDAASKVVYLSSGEVIGYDRLVLAPGIAFENVPGWDPRIMPHAWIAGAQTELLRDKIAAIPTGGTFLMTVPKSPYRCPPGPYERACLVAGLMREKGGGKVIVLDANAGIQAEKDTFNRAFTELYGDIVEYIPNATANAVDSDSMNVSTEAGTFSADVINLIPNQRAPALLVDAGLVSGGAKWAQVDPVSYESTIYAGVHVVGDAQGTGQPKSAHMGNSQAKVCADAILCALQGQDVHATTRTANITTNSACYSPITRTEASWLTANFALENGQMKLVHIGEAGRWTGKNYREMFTWANNLFGDTFM